MRLLYGTTTSVVVTLTDRFGGSRFRLYFADEFNATANPNSSNPFELFLMFRSIVQQNDITHPKFVAHLNGVRRGVRMRLAGTTRQDALKTITRMGIQAVQPYLAILECDTYAVNHGVTIVPLSPNEAGSPTSIEYLIGDIRGPSLPDRELHLQRLY